MYIKIFVTEIFDDYIFDSQCNNLRDLNRVWVYSNFPKRVSFCNSYLFSLEKK